MSPWEHTEYGGVKRPRGVLKPKRGPKPLPKTKPKPGPKNPSWIDKARAALERIKQDIKTATESKTTREVAERSDKEQW